jgi:hypothetical protein
MGNNSNELYDAFLRQANKRSKLIEEFIAKSL